MSFTFVDGQETNEGSTVKKGVKEVKTDKTHRNVKQRGVTQKTYDFTGNEGADDLVCATWSLYDLGMQPIASNMLVDEHDILSLAVHVICASPTARAMAIEAAEDGWRAGIADLQGKEFFLDIARKTILLDNNALEANAIGRSGYVQNTLIMGLVKAMRDIWHERRNGAFAPYGPEGLLMLERVRAADIDVVAVQSAWELRSEGYGDIWRYMIGTDEGDIAMAFSAIIEHDPGTFLTGKAMRAAFVRWFDNRARVDMCDHQTLEYMDDILGGGGRLGSKRPSPMDIEFLSCQPDRRAYLQGFGREIINSPRYAGLHDTINQAHFMQVMQDKDLTFAGGVAFANPSLARRIFPDGEGGDFY